MPFLRRLVDEVVKLLVGGLQIVVNDDDVVNAGSLGVLELTLGLGQALLHALLGLGAAAAEALLAALGDRGPVFVYHDFEKWRIMEMARSRASFLLTSG